MKIKDLLKKHNGLTKEIANVDYHMGLLNVDLDELQFRIPGLKEKTEMEVFEYISSIYKMCDASKTEYDSSVDEAMVRIGLKTNQFPGGHNRNKWNNGGLFEDDGFGFGTEPTSLYDDFIDSQNNNSKRK